MKNKRAGGSRRGQAIVEYLIILTVIVLAILAFRGPLGAAINGLLFQAEQKIYQAAAQLQSL